MFTLVQPSKNVQNNYQPKVKQFGQCTVVYFASFLSGGFTTMAIINASENKLAKRTSVQWFGTKVDEN